jgi:hypothetical protein
VQTGLTVRQPDDVPIGPAELIMFVNDKKNGALPNLRAPSPIGLFENDVDVVDEAMGYGEHRAFRDDSGRGVARTIENWRAG